MNEDKHDCAAPGLYFISMLILAICMWGLSARFKMDDAKLDALTARVAALEARP